MVDLRFLVGMERAGEGEGGGGGPAYPRPASRGGAESAFLCWRGALSFPHTKKTKTGGTHQVFYVKSAQICLRQPSRLNVILFAFPDHSRTEKVSDVSCLSRGLRRAPVSDEAPR